MKLPSPVVAARRLAAKLVDERTLVPPINVEELLAEFADVEFADWPQVTVDAVVSGLGQVERPRVFLRQGAPSHRQRFSMAHELAHIVVPWHMGRYTCTTAAVGDLDLTTFGQEDEADVFASAVLLPDAWLKSFVVGNPDDMSVVLEQLNQADVSTAAAMSAVRGRLLAGWIFGGYAGNQAWSSPGTSYPVHDREHILEYARKNCSEAGEATLNGYAVQWYRMHPASELPPEDADSRSTTELLDSAIAILYASAETRIHVQRSANGKVGGALRAAGGQPAANNLSVLRYRLADWEYAELLDEPEFQTWLVRKARDVEQRPPSSDG